MMLAWRLADTPRSSGPLVRCRRGVLRTLAGTAALLIAVAAAEAKTGKPDPTARLFGAGELHKGSSRSLPKWGDALERHRQDIAALAERCAVAGGQRCGIPYWQELIASLEGQSRRGQLEALNRYVNRFPYVPDSRNYGRNDYWASPRELFTRGGDCEDYAIAKFLALETLGLRPDQMRLVVVEDHQRQDFHAALVVYLDGERWLLDNQLSKVVTVEEVDHYRPIYSIDGSHWILYETGAGGAKASRKQPASR